MHPKSEIYKKYYIKVFGEVKKEEIEELKKGVLLEDGKTLPAKVSGIPANLGRIEYEEEKDDDLDYEFYEEETEETEDKKDEFYDEFEDDDI